MVEENLDSQPVAEITWPRSIASEVTARIRKEVAAGKPSHEIALDLMDEEKNEISKMFLSYVPDDIQEAMMGYVDIIYGLQFAFELEQGGQPVRWDYFRRVAKYSGSLAKQLKSNIKFDELGFLQQAEEDLDLLGQDETGYLLCDRKLKRIQIGVGEGSMRYAGAAAAVQRYKNLTEKIGFLMKNSDRRRA